MLLGKLQARNDTLRDSYCSSLSGVWKSSEGTTAIEVDYINEGSKKEKSDIRSIDWLVG